MNKRILKTPILLILTFAVACLSAEASISTRSQDPGKFDPRVTSARPEGLMLPPANLVAQDPMQALIQQLNQQNHGSILRTRGEVTLEAARRSRHHRHLQRIQERKKGGKKPTPQLPPG
jgi:hypothetical protein